jgi:dCTP deaminase
MILNDYRIQQLSIADNLIVPYDKERLQPHSIDLTLGNQLLIPSSKTSSGVIYNEEDNVWIEERSDETIAIPPFAFVLAHTFETLTIPNNLVGIVQGKSTIGRRGLQIECAGLIDAGFSGQITLELFNMAPYIIKLKVGMPICQVKFFEGESAALVDYRQVGHYCGQRGATPPHSIKPFN